MKKHGGAFVVFSLRIIPDHAAVIVGRSIVDHMLGGAPVGVVAPLYTLIVILGIGIVDPVGILRDLEGIKACLRRFVNIKRLAYREQSLWGRF